jgi:hypothetical protein
MIRRATDQGAIVPHPPARLTACVTAIAALAATPALAQVPPRTRGTITVVTSDIATLHTGAGTLQVSLPASGYVGARRATLADIKPGSFIGTAAVPGSDGKLRALEVAIFPDSMRGTGEGSYPWDLGASGSMTNGTIAGIDGASSMTNGTVHTSTTRHGLTLTVTYKGGQQTVQVPPTTPVVMLEPGTRALLHPGVQVVIFGPTNVGVIQARRIIVGENGTKPPM